MGKVHDLSSRSGCVTSQLFQGLWIQWRCILYLVPCFIKSPLLHPSALYSYRKLFFQCFPIPTDFSFIWACRTFTRYCLATAHCLHCQGLINCDWSLLKWLKDRLKWLSDPCSHLKHLFKMTLRRLKPGSFHRTWQFPLYVAVSTVLDSLHCTWQSPLYLTVPTVPGSLHCTWQFPLYLTVCTVSDSLHCTWQSPLYLTVSTLPDNVHCTWQSPLYLAVSTVPDRYDFI